MVLKGYLTIFLGSFILAFPNIGHPIEDDRKNIRNMALIYQSAMRYIFLNQKLINTNKPGVDKTKLFGKKFIKEVKNSFKEKYKFKFPDEENKLVQVLLTVMEEVMEDNKTLILDNDLKFKGLIPAIFAYQISERLKMNGNGLIIKFVSPKDKTRNKMNYPDSWETEVMNRFTKTISKKPRDWYQTNINYTINKREYKVDRYFTTVPMKKFCLNCHGTPKDNPLNRGKIESDWVNTDVTGFVMENWTMDDFGGGVSVVLTK